MNAEEYIKPGITREETFTIAEEHTAYHIGSGDTRVLATPWMISLMERVSNRLLGQHLPDGYMSVGTHVNVYHLAATPIGVGIRVCAEVTGVRKNRIELAVHAWDQNDKLGEGTHERAVVNREHFMQNTSGKSDLQQSK